MRIEFEAIRFKNILSIGNDFVKIRLNTNDFTVIVGDNGAGKSTIIDALAYVLYNRAYRKITLPMLINSINKKNMLVEVIFMRGKDKFIVRRGRGPDVFEIYKNGDLMKEESLTSGYQSYLENEVLGMNYKTFSQLCVVAKATYKPFMELTPVERRTIVENVLDSNIYTLMKDVGAAEVKQIKMEISDLNNELRVEEAKLSSTRAMLEEYNSNKDEKIKNFNNELDELKKTIEGYSRQQVELEKIISDARESFVSDLRDPRMFMQKFEEMKSEDAELSREISRHMKTISNISNIEKCPTCGQEMDETHLAQCIAEADEHISKAKTKQKLIQAKIEMFNNMLDKANMHKNAANEASSKLQQISGDADYTRRMIARIEGEIAELSKPVKLPSDINVDILEKSVQDVTEKIDNKTEMCDKFNKALSLLGDSGIKSILINEEIPIINEHINEYLSRMDLFADFELDSQFNETIKSRFRDKFKYESFSEGQKARIEAAILLTWRQVAARRNSTTTNILFLDEIMDGSLNARGVQDFFGILRDETDQSVFVISHNESTIDMFENKILVTQEGNFANYEEV